MKKGERELVKPGAKPNVLKLIMKTVGALIGGGAVSQWLYIESIESGS